MKTDVKMRESYILRVQRGLGCSVAQLIARLLAVRQARVRISYRGSAPTELTAVKIWRWASANVYENDVWM